MYNLLFSFSFLYRLIKVLAICKIQRIKLLDYFLYFIYIFLIEFLISSRIARLLTAASREVEWNAINYV